MVTYIHNLINLKHRNRVPCHRPALATLLPFAASVASASALSAARWRSRRVASSSASLDESPNQQTNGGRGALTAGREGSQHSLQSVHSYSTTSQMWGGLPGVTVAPLLAVPSLLGNAAESAGHGLVVLENTRAPLEDEGDEEIKRAARPARICCQCRRSR
jgi:hypothetical protein